MIYVLIGVPVLLVLLWVLALRTKRRKFGFYGLSDHHYAHRGLHDSAQGIPENSLTAFRRAVEYGYGAELDVHLSKDGRLVVMHDESLLRMTGVDRSICDCTKEELREYRLEGTDEPITSMEQVLPIFAGKAPLVIELKAFQGNHAALARRVCQLLRRYPSLDYCIESFDPRVLVYLRKHHPEVVRGQLSCNFMKDRSGLQAATAFILTALLTNFLTVPHFIAYRYEDRKRPGLWLCRTLWGVQEFGWTLRSTEQVENAAKHGVLAIFEHCMPQEMENGNV